MLKTISLAISTLALLVYFPNLSGSLSEKCEIDFKQPPCQNSITAICCTTTQDAQVSSYSYRTSIICDAVEYEWILDLGTSGETSSTTTSWSYTMSPLAWQLGGNPLCGAHTLSVRAKVDNGVDPPFWTATFTKNITVVNCP